MDSSVGSSVGTVGEAGNAVEEPTGQAAGREDRAAASTEQFGEDVEDAFGR